jgi:S-DNA-T family DNA segregation ATPase FtsK/SpoIIIE
LEGEKGAPSIAVDLVAAGEVDQVVTDALSGDLERRLAVGVGLDSAGEDKAWAETITARPAALRPDVYSDWKPEQLSAALKPYGLKTVHV